MSDSGLTIDDKKYYCPNCGQENIQDKHITEFQCFVCRKDLIVDHAGTGSITVAIHQQQSYATCPGCNSSFVVVGTETHLKCPICFREWRPSQPLKVEQRDQLGDTENRLTGRRYPPPEEGLKYDQGKLQWELFPAESAEQIIKVLMFGATKYDPWNWSKGIKFSRLFAALMRHMWAWYRGETNDPETGLNHLSHAACCLAFLLSYSQRKDYLEQFDDRPAYYRQNGWFTKTEGGWVEVPSDDVIKGEE